jgi:pantetheine-phosphate adenylyltransferase
MTTALYAGSFDPITLGHFDIIKQSSEIFEKVIIGVAFNPEKKGFLSVPDRVELIKECVKNIPNSEVHSYEGLTVNFANEHNAKVLIRGLRDSADFEYEYQLAKINSDLASNIKTVFLTSKPEYNYISSSSVRELLSQNCDIRKYVPECVSRFLKANV